MGQPKTEVSEIYKYIKRVDDFYVRQAELVKEAAYLDERYGRIVSGYDVIITHTSWLNTYSESDLATISGDLVGVKQYAPMISGWRYTYTPEEI